jgi:hypothetical protein
MDLVLPPSGVSDWHLVLHLGLYPEWSKLTARTYQLSGSNPAPSRALFSPRILERPGSEWDAVQSLALGIDLICGRLYQ